MASTTARLGCSLHMRFTFVRCSTLSTIRTFHANNAPSLRQKESTTSANGAELVELNRLLFERTRIEIQHNNSKESDHFFRVALCYTINGMPILPTSTWISREANNRRNWQLCVSLKAIIASSRHFFPPASSSAPTNSADNSNSLLFMLPIHQAGQLLNCLEQLQLGGIGTFNADGPLKIHRQRLSGPLFGDKKSAFYLSVCRPPKKLSSTPLVYLSEHLLYPNIFHAWHPVVNSVSLSLCCLSKLCECFQFVLGQPEVSADDHHQIKQSSSKQTHIGQMFFA